MDLPIGARFASGWRAVFLVILGVGAPTGCESEGAASARVLSELSITLPECARPGAVPQDRTAAISLFMSAAGEIRVLEGQRLPERRSGPTHGWPNLGRTTLGGTRDAKVEIHHASSGTRYLVDERTLEDLEALAEYLKKRAENYTGLGPRGLRVWILPITGATHGESMRVAARLLGISPRLDVALWLGGTRSGSESPVGRDAALEKVRSAVKSGPGAPHPSDLTRSVSTLTVRALVDGAVAFSRVEDLIAELSDLGVQRVAFVLRDGPSEFDLVLPVTHVEIPPPYDPTRAGTRSLREKP